MAKLTREIRMLELARRMDQGQGFSIPEAARMGGVTPRSAHRDLNDIKRLIKARSRTNGNPGIGVSITRLVADGFRE